MFVGTRTHVNLLEGVAHHGDQHVQHHQPHHYVVDHVEQRAEGLRQAVAAAVRFLIDARVVVHIRVFRGAESKQGPEERQECRAETEKWKTTKIQRGANLIWFCSS